VTENEVIKAIRSKPAGSSGGPGGLHLQHLLDSINCQEVGHALVSSITALTNSLLDGRCPSDVTALLFEGMLCELSKQSGDVRSIVIGYMSRRFVADCTVMPVLMESGFYVFSWESAHQEALKLWFMLQDGS
jgi:hypothetical protein